MMGHCPPHDCGLEDLGNCPRCGESRLSRIGGALDEAREQVEHWESEVDRYEGMLTAERRRLAVASGRVVVQ